jgi:hypothetical protein
MHLADYMALSVDTPCTIVNASFEIGGKHHEMDKLLYSRKETAALLSISVRRLDYLIEQGIFKPCRIGRKVTIPSKQITKFAAGDWPELRAGWPLANAGRGQHQIQ